MKWTNFPRRAVEASHGHIFQRRGGLWSEADHLTFKPTTPGMEADGTSHNLVSGVFRVSWVAFPIQSQMRIVLHLHKPEPPLVSVSAP